MMGFTGKEVVMLLKQVAPDMSSEACEHMLDNLKKWYNGYFFSGEAETRLYNPDMLLYFFKEFTYKNA